MNRTIEQLIKTRTFQSLSPEEREQIREWASTEDEFEQMKQVLISAQYMAEKSAKTPAPSVKRQLDERFKNKYSADQVKGWRRFMRQLWPEEQPLFFRPAFQVGVVVLLVAFTLPFFERESVKIAEQSYDPSTSEAIEELREKKRSSKPEEEKREIRVQNEQRRTGEDKGLSDNEFETSPQKKSEEKRTTDSKRPQVNKDNVEENISQQVDDRVRMAEPTDNRRDQMGSQPVSETISAAQEELVDGESKQRSMKKDESSLLQKEQQKVEPAATVDLLVSLY